MKVIDASCHTKGDEVTQKFKHALVIVYAKRLEDCPIVRKVGDVLRVHRANTREHKGTRQFHVNVNFNASWVLFPACPSDDKPKENENEEEGGEDSTEENPKLRKSHPYKYSGKNYSFDTNNDLPLLEGVKRWSADYFAHNSVVNKSNYTKLRDLR